MRPGHRISILGLAIAMALASAACANELVTNTNDAGLGSLRQAILDANALGSPSTITFNTAPGSPFAGAVPATIILTSGELIITAPFTIQGTGANLLIVSGSHASRVFNINPGAGNAVNMSGLTIRDGAPPAASGNGGGGILISGGTLNLSDSEVTNNDASQSSAPLGGGIDNEGAVVNLERCAIVNNTGASSGGGIQNAGAGSMTLVNCTLAGNGAGVSGVGGGVRSLTTLNLVNCTIFGNSAQTGGNTSIGAGAINFQNTIIAGGVMLGSGGSGPDISGAGYNSLDYNLIQNTSGGTITGAITHNLTGVSPMLGALGNNGGPTRTLAISVGSPALDAGSAVNDPITSAPLAIDQRGSPRPVDDPFVANAAGGNGSDIGAYELQPSPPTISVPPSAFAFENGSSGAIPFTVGDVYAPTASLVVSAMSSDTSILPQSGIVFGGMGANLTITMTPAAGKAGTVTVTVVVSDGTLVSDGFLLLTVTTPTSITSPASTTFTIGQQCPEIVLTGPNDDPQPVGTPCPFTVTTSGSPIPTITLGGVLPAGVIFTDNLDGTGTLGGVPAPGTAGNYPLTFTATNSLGSSPTQNFTLTINTPPEFVSGPTATPNPANVGQTVTFNAGAFDADGNALTYQWNFGDGSNIATGATVTNTYSAPGTYIVYVIVTDTASAFTYDMVYLTVNGNGSSEGNGNLGSGNENQSLVGAGQDSDGDGYSDIFETAVGTDPHNPGSTPTGQPLSAAALQALTLSTAAIKLNFAKPGGDAITFAGSLPIPAGFNASGAKVYFDVGGVAKVLSLDAKGSAKVGGDSVKLMIKSKKGAVAAQTAKFTVAFSKGAFTSLLAAGTPITNSTVRNAPVTVKFTFIFNNVVYQKAQSMFFTAKMNKTGAAKQARP